MYVRVIRRILLLMGYIYLGDEKKLQGERMDGAHSCEGNTEELYFPILSHIFFYYNKNETHESW